MNNESRDKGSSLLWIYGYVHCLPPFKEQTQCLNVLLDRDGTSFRVAAGTLYPWIKKKRPCVECGCVLYSGNFETPKLTWPCFRFHRSRFLLFSSSTILPGKIRLLLSIGVSGILEHCCTSDGALLVSVWPIHFYATRRVVYRAYWLHRGYECITADEWDTQGPCVSLFQILDQALLL